jgi:hypothetical protein
MEIALGGGGGFRAFDGRPSLPSDVTYIEPSMRMNPALKLLRLPEPRKANRAIGVCLSRRRRGDAVGAHTPWPPVPTFGNATW